jgi:hypothetical protein
VSEDPLYIYTEHTRRDISGKPALDVPERPHLRPGGLPTEAWELLDPALQEALLEGRIAPEDLHELTGWLDEEEPVP